MEAAGPAAVVARHVSLGEFRLDVDQRSGRWQRAELVFTENETNARRVFGLRRRQPVREGRLSRLRDPRRCGGRQSAAGRHEGRGDLSLDDAGGRADRRAASAHGSRRSRRAQPLRRLRRRLRRAHRARPTSSTPSASLPMPATTAANVARQAYAGLLWSKQFYHYVVKDWLDGDADQPPPPPSSPRRPQSRLAAPVQSRRHLDARQVGVPLVRRVGPGVPHDPDGDGSIPSSPRGSSSCSCANGTCTPTARCRRTNGRCRTSTRRCTRGPAGASTR